ncbi:hypothetical protein J7J18_04675 [bacterium]|nr:hypothetical protein [bacterium]
MPTYTTYDIVKDRVKQISADLTQAKIEENINQAESIVDAVMKMTARGSNPDFTFDADKHGIIRDATTCIAALLCIMYDTSGFSSRAEAAFVCDLLWNEANRCLALLYDEKGKNYLKNL